MSVGSISLYVLSHKRNVALAWLSLVIVGVLLLPWATGQLSDGFVMPGTESSAANSEIIQRYGSGGYALPLIPVVTLPEGTTVDSPGVRAELQAVFDRAQAVRPEARVVSWASTDDNAFVSEDRRTTYGLIFLKDAGDGSVGDDEVQAAVAGMSVGGEPVRLTGSEILVNAREDSSGGGDNEVLVETLVGGVGALVILLYVFGSAVALLPLLIAAIAIVVSFLVIGLIGTTIEINTVVEYLVALIGLGVAIDYSLLVVNRWREERILGHPNKIAVQRAMETAGHAVLFSGTTVGVGLLALIALPMPIFRGIGIGGMVIPVVSVLVTITLLPIVLATIGPRLDWPRFSKRKISHKGWERFATAVIRHRWAAALSGTLFLGLLVFAATTMCLGSPRPEAAHGAGEPQIALDQLNGSGLGSGMFNPFEVIVHSNPDALALQLSAVKGVRAAIAPAEWRTNDSALITVIPSGDGGGDGARTLIKRIRSVTHASEGRPLVGGAGALDADFTDQIYAHFPMMLLIITIATFLLLVRAFRSIILPIKALLLNGLSIGASYGVMVLVWQMGWGSNLLWGIPSTGAVTGWIPILAFAFLFGLSMDYEVFILHRMREEYDREGNTNRAVIKGLAHTGKLVTCAAMILVLAFVSMASAPETDVKMISTALAAGILIDATVIRILLVPALISLMGSWNWWMPRWMSRFGAPDQHLSVGPAQTSSAD
jgi:putative drug exporter of the RND superfamily